MKNKKTKLIRIFILAFAIAYAVWANGGISIALNNTARAVGDLSVDWGGLATDPMFAVNLAPGQFEEKTVTVTNDGPIARTVGVRGEKISDLGNLSSVFEIIISESGIDLYGGTSGIKTLSDFFADSASLDGIELSSLNPTESASYVFKVIFDIDAGNEFQNQELKFDLFIGIAIPTPEDCTNFAVTGEVVFGTAGNNRIRGTSGNDLIFGLEGNDRIDGLGGDDCILGGEGNDNIDDSSGNDVIFGEVGNDDIDSGSGNDLVFGGDGNDKLDGGTGEDQIFGGIGEDKVEGSTGNDEMFGGDQNDLMEGGSGNDEIFGENGNDNLKGGSDNDSLDGGSGNNTLSGDTGTDTCINGPTIKKCELP